MWEGLGRSRLRFLVLLLVLVLGTASTLYAYYSILRNAEAVELLEYRTAVESFARDFTEYIRHQGQVAESFAGLMTVAPDTTQEDFDGFAARVSPSYPSVVAVNWFPRTAPADIPQIERRLAAIGADNPRLHKADDTVIEAATLGRDAFPIVLSSPLERNRAILGFDVASSPLRLPTLEQARDTGETVGTEPVKLIQHPDVIGASLYVPVYHAGADTSDAQTRRQALRGFI